MRFLSLSAISLCVLVLNQSITQSIADLGWNPEINLLPPEACTALAIGRLASKSHSPMTTHTNDCKDCDFRLSLVPGRVYESKNHSHVESSDMANHLHADEQSIDEINQRINQSNKQSRRYVPKSRFTYPRYVGDDRGPSLMLENTDQSINQSINQTEFVGSVPQANETYQYIDGAYGIINEWGVAIGESTCAARLVSVPVYAIDQSVNQSNNQSKGALFDMSELTRIGLERSKSARQAIEVIGQLAYDYGFYGAEWTGAYAAGEAGEALTIVDRDEAWVMHMTPDDTGSSAVWVAQRVPDNHISVVANAFNIQQINLTDSKNFMASPNIFKVARRLGWFTSEDDSDFNFARIYGARVSFEEYCSRRVWRVFSLVNPSLMINQSPYVGVLDLPFSIPVSDKLSVHDVMQIQRDHYEGTEFDLTQGLAAGPFGNPNRYDRGESINQLMHSSKNDTQLVNVTMAVLMQGSFERPISVFRTAYSFVTESRHDLIEHQINRTLTKSINQSINHIASRVWFGQSQPHATFYVPLYPNSLTLPDSMTTGSLYEYDDSTAWWLVNTVGNWMEKAWCHINVDVSINQRRVEKQLLEEADQLENDVIQFIKDGPESDEDAINQSMYQSINQSMKKPIDVPSSMTDFQNYHTDKSTNRWKRLLHHLIAKYHDGYRVDDWHAIDIDPIAMFYPIDWLIDVGFFGESGKQPDWKKNDWSYTSEYEEHENKTKMHKTSRLSKDQSISEKHRKNQSINQSKHSETGYSMMFVIVSNALSVLLGSLIGVLIVRHTRLLGSDQRGQYQPI